MSNKLIDFIGEMLEEDAIAENEEVRYYSEAETEIAEERFWRPY